MSVARDYDGFVDWIVTYDFKDGVQQVCLMIDMFYTLINFNTISDVDNQWQIIH